MSCWPCSSSYGEGQMWSKKYPSALDGWPKQRGGRQWARHKQPQGSLAAAEGLRSQLVVSVQEAQLRSAGGIEGRYGMNPVPGGWLPATAGNSQLIYLDQQSGARSRGKSKNSVTKVSIPQTSWNHLLLSSSNASQRLASFKCDVEWEGRERVQMRPMKSRTWEFPAFCTWVESPDFSLGCHYHS